MSVSIDPALFSEEAISKETHTFNEALVAQISSGPDMWQSTPAEIRAARMSGRGPFPLEPAEPSARTINVPGTDGEIAVRIFTPKAGTAKGSYLHIHGGGWVIGSSLTQDARLQEIADRCSFTCLSVEYRLAPEQPYPAGPDDCEAAALWLVNGDHEFETGFLAIGGESAGAHLAVVTLLRLKNRLNHCPFHAANLTAGVFDLGGTASCRNWGVERLVLNTRDMRMFVSLFLQSGEDMRNSDVSPLYADLDGLPPALFSVGTRDLLLDDTLQMATRWHAANGNAELDVTPGGCHVFQNFRDLAISQASNQRIDTFLSRAFDQQ